MILLAGIGAVSVLGQIVLLRELLVALFGSELVYLLAFATLLLATTMGTLLGGAVGRPPSRDLSRSLLLLGLATPALALLARGLHPLLGGVPGGYLPIGRQLASLGTVLVPFGLLVGFLFQRSSAWWVGTGRGLPAAYALDAAGGLAGGLAATALAAAGWANLSAALLCALAAALLGGVVVAGRRRRLWLAAGGVLASAAAVGLWQVDGLERAATAWQHPEVVAAVDTPYGRVSVVRRLGQVVVLVNGALSFDSEDEGAQVLAHMAALQVAAPRRMLVLGDQGYQVAGELLAHGPERLDVVVVDERAHRLVVSHLPAASTAAMAAPAVRLHCADPRRFLQAAGRYDVIVIAGGEPESGRVNRLYTREFFALCRAHLEADGVLAFQLEAAENLWSPALLRRTASIHRAAAAVFADILLLPGTTATLLASPAPLSRSPALLAGRWQARRIEASLVEPHYIAYLLTDERGAAALAGVAGTAAPPNTDARPSCYPYTLLLWLARFVPRLNTWQWAPTRSQVASAIGLGLAAWAAGLAWARVRAERRAAWWVGTNGFAGMLLEAVLLLHYQTHSGVLYQDLGLLITVFMAGMAAGALLADRLGWRWERRPRQAGAALLGSTVVLYLAAAWLVRAGSLGTLAAWGVLLLVGGLQEGALFGLGSALGGRPRGRGIARLYAADLFGGCVAALTGTLALIPLGGLDLALVLGAVLVGSLGSLL